LLKTFTNYSLLNNWLKSKDLKKFALNELNFFGK